MQINLVQKNLISADVAGNLKIAKNVLQNMKETDRACLTVFSDCFLQGIKNDDILKTFPHIIAKEKSAIVELLKYFNKNYGILTTSDEILLLHDKKIEKKAKSGDIIEIEGKRFAVLTEFDTHLKIKNADFILIIKSTITYSGAEHKKNAQLAAFSKNLKTPLIYINQIGAFDEKIYEGASRYYDANGEILACAPYFKEAVFSFDTKTGGAICCDMKEYQKAQNDFSLDYKYDLKRTYNALILAIRDYFYKNGFTHATLGLSGGLDSSACAALLSHALGAENVLGVLMPSAISSAGSKNDAKKLAQNLGIKYVEIPIAKNVDCLKDTFINEFQGIDFEKYDKSYTNDNIQARIRASILFGITNEFKGFLTIATCDKSEDYMGYSTINGDMSGSFSPIGDVTKTKLKALCNFINKNGGGENGGKEIIPQVIIDKKPTAELEIIKGDFLYAEDALMPYAFMDEAIFRFEKYHQNANQMMKHQFLYERENGVDEAKKRAWLDKFFVRFQNARFKQTITPVVPKIEETSLGDYKHFVSTKFA